MDSNSGDPGSLRNFSVLLLPHPRVFSRLPAPVPCLPWGRPTGCSGLLKNPAGCAPPDRRAGERG